MFRNVTGVDVKTHNTGNWAKGYETELRKDVERKKEEVGNVQKRC